MRVNRLLQVAVLVSGVVLCTACSSTKSKGANGADQMNGTQASGMGANGGNFGDASGGNFDDANKMKAPYDQRYHFAFNKYDVLPGDVESIKVQANYLVAHNTARVRLEGNADERGSREYNVALGWKRAKAVAAIFKQEGVSDTQIVMVSYGKEKPIAFGHDESAYSQNRRVDLIYEAK